MADNYLHSLYPNLRPQIDEAITQGYSYQEIQDQIAGRVNEARRNGYNDEEIEGYTGAKLSTAKQGYNPFLSQLYKSAGAVNKGVAGFTKGITESGQYISEKLGFGRSKATDDIVNSIIEQYKANEEYWETKAKEKGATFIDEIVGEAVGGGIPGVLEFALGVPYYTVQGAIEAKSQGQNEVIGAVQGAVKRVLLGKLFHSFRVLKQPLKAVAMGGTMAGETAGAGGTLEEIAKAGGTGVIFSLGGRGRIGVREIKDLHTGEVIHEPVVRSNIDIFKSESDLSEVVMKKARQEAVPPTGQHLELMPDEYPTIKGVAIEANGKVYEAKAGEATHVQVMLSNGLKPEESVSGYTKTNGEFVTQSGEGKVTPRLLEVEKEENLILSDVIEGKELNSENITRLDKIKAEKAKEAEKIKEKRENGILREIVIKDVEEAAKFPPEEFPILKTEKEAEAITLKKEVITEDTKILIPTSESLASHGLGDRFVAAFYDLRTKNVIETPGRHDPSKLTKEQADLMDEGYAQVGKGFIDESRLNVQAGFYDKQNKEFLNTTEMEEWTKQGIPAPITAPVAGERGLIRTTIIDGEAIYGGGPGTHTGDVLGKYGVIPDGKKIETGWTKTSEFDATNPRSGFMTNEEATNFIKGGTRTPEGEGYEKFIEETTKQPPIVEYRRQAIEIESKLLILEEGYTRLWRGNRPGEVGIRFTDDLPGIALPFRDAYKGDLVYIDVLTSDLNKYRQTVAVAEGEYVIPQKLALKAKMIREEPEGVGAEKAEIDAKKIKSHMRAIAQMEKEAGFEPGGSAIINIRTEIDRMMGEIDDFLRESRENPDVARAKAKYDRVLEEADELPNAEWLVVTKEARDEFNTIMDMFTEEYRAERVGFSEVAMKEILGDKASSWAKTHDGDWENALLWMDKYAKLAEGTLTNIELRQLKVQSIEVLDKVLKVKQMFPGGEGITTSWMKDLRGKLLEETNPSKIRLIIDKMASAQHKTGGLVDLAYGLGEKKGEPDVFKLMLDRLAGGVYKVKPEGVGAEKARKETKLYGTLLEQQKQAEDNLTKLANLAITNPKVAFLKGNVEALEDYAVRVDKGVFEAKMESLHPFGDNSIWLQEGYESPGDFWDKATTGSREAAKAVFDRNWKKVGELAGDIDKQIDNMINTAERMSREAFNSGDKLGAAREHKKLMDLKKNREVIKREHEKLKNEVNSMTGKMGDWATMESIDPDYRDQIQMILEDYDLHRRGEAYKGKRQSTLDFIAKQEEIGEAIYISEDKIRKLRKVPIGDVSVEELRSMFGVVEQLAHLGKLKKKLILARRNKDFATNKDELLASIKENSLNYVELGDKDVQFPSEREPKSLWGRFKKKIGSFSGATKVEYIADKLDGFKGKIYEVQGKAYDLIFRPSTIAEATRIRLIRSDLDSLNSIIDPIKKDFLRIMTEQESISGRDMTRMEMISIYWNSRNEGNRETLRRGLALSDDNIDNIVGKLNPAEIKFANDVMTLIQSKGPGIAEVLRNLTGEKMKFEKDYFPIWFDYELSERASQRQQETDLLKQVYMKVGAERGFTVSRVGGVEAPYLSFDVVLKHLEKVNHFISSAEAIRDVQKVIFDKDIRRAIESSAGEGGYRETVEWLKDWGNPKRGYQGDLDRWFGILRHNSTLAVLGFRFSTAILQPTAYLQLINRIGFKNSMVGLMDFYKDIHGNTARIYEMSPFMRTRSHSFDRDLMDYMNSDAFYKKSERFKHAAMGAISALDLAATLPAWQSAFNLGVKQFGWNEARAVEYADLIVRRTQGSGMPKDLPGVLRGSNYKKIFTMFYTYFSSTYNEAARDYRAFKAGEENLGNLVKSFTLLFVVPAVIQSLMRKREDVKGKDFVTEIIGNVAGTIPYVGPVVNAIITGYDYQASPIFEMPKQLVMAAKSEDWDKKMEHMFIATGYMTGIPARQTILMIKYLGDVLSGRSYDPANLVYREKKKEGGWK